MRREVSTSDEIRWDPAAGKLDVSLLQGADALVNLSGENLGKRWTDSRKRTILDSRVQSTELLARTGAALDPKPSVLVVASAVGFYGDRGSEILTEESAAGTGFLADVVRAWEAAADPAREAGIRVVHLRQGIVISKEGGALEPMLRPFRLGVGGRVGSGKQWWSWIGMEDVVACYAHVLEGDLAGAINATAPNPVTNEQFTKALGSALHRPTVLPFPPSPPARSSARWATRCSSVASACCRLDSSKPASTSRRRRSTSVWTARSRRRSFVTPSATMDGCRNSRRLAGTRPGAPHSSRTPSWGSCRGASRFSTAANTTW